MAGHAATSMAANMERRKWSSLKSSLRYRSFFLSTSVSLTTASHSRIFLSTLPTGAR